MSRETLVYRRITLGLVAALGILGLAYTTGRIQGAADRMGSDGLAV